MYTDEEDEVPSLADFLVHLTLILLQIKKLRRMQQHQQRRKAVPKRASVSQKKTISKFSSDDEQIQTISEEKGSNGNFEPPAALKGLETASFLW
ncbi:uncharacterized protein LOC113336019 isoform X2 [Papaver somniferum]|uniref:uncharacterized protein LOC113336019 isoform X2 n=1 Tax=Papaver somniferum TaxID=3469 RepID=UPI000E6FC03A|nr:uncharacterized protein LOC113336019 isoform X2 [Papaver somniferum]